jgi:hypothetical protein
MTEASFSLTEPLLKPADAAELLAVKPSWIYEAVRAGTLPCLRSGATFASRGRCWSSGWQLELDRPQHDASAYCFRAKAAAEQRCLGLGRRAGSGGRIRSAS